MLKQFMTCWTEFCDWKSSEKRKKKEEVFKYSKFVLRTGGIHLWVRNRL